MFALLDTPEKESFGMLLWQIWKERNELVWKGINRRPGEAVFISASFLHEWRSARDNKLAAGGMQRRVGAAGAAGCRAWHPPTVGKLKCNVDAAFFEDTNQTGIGMVLRDDVGHFILARTMVFHGRLEVDVGEVMGFFEALSWLQTLNLGSVVIEGDSKIVVDALKSSNTLDSIFGDYVNACKVILYNSPLFSVHFVRRDDNSLAHEFAQVSRLYGPVHCWFDPPPFVDGHPCFPCSCNNMS